MNTGAEGAISYGVWGDQGPTVMLVHGGAPPELTWSRQRGLADDFVVLVPWRRGYPPSAAASRQDWEVDAQDILSLAPDGTHLVAHSYGGLGALWAATRSPDRFASLTLIEAPFFCLAAGDPDVEHLAALGRAFGQGAPGADHSEFLAIAGLPAGHPELESIARIAKGMRDPPAELPDIDRLQDLPCLVVSGGHHAGIERVCSALAGALAAERWIATGHGHAVQKHPDFNARLRALVERAQP